MTFGPHRVDGTAASRARVLPEVPNTEKFLLVCSCVLTLSIGLGSPMPGFAGIHTVATQYPPGTTMLTPGCIYKVLQDSAPWSYVEPIRQDFLG